MMYWLDPHVLWRNHITNKILDKWFLDKLKEGEHFTIIGPHTAQFAGKEVWISNYPYASFTIYRQDYVGMPSRRTVKKLHKALIEDMLNQGE